MRNSFSTHSKSSQKIGRFIEFFERATGIMFLKQLSLNNFKTYAKASGAFGKHSKIL